MEQTSAASQPTEQQPPPSSSPAPPQPSPSSTTLLPPPSSSLPAVPPPSSSSSPLQSSPNPNPNPNPSNSQTRPPFNRPWSQPPFSSSSPSSSSVSATPGQRSGGMAIGVPAHHPGPPPPPPASFSSLSSPSFGQQYGGLARNSTNVPDSVASPTTSQVRQPVQGIQGMGTMGSFGSGTQIRPGGIAAHHQRPVQSSPRPQSTPNNQSPASQNFPGHGMLRVSSVGTPGSPSPSTSQNLQAHNQPWLSSGSQGKPPLPSPPFRPQMNSLSLQQRSHIPQQHHHPMSTASQQPQASSSHQQQQQPSSSHPPQEHLSQQFPPTRVPQSITHQLQMAARGSVLGNQKPSSLTAVQPSTVQSGPPNKTTVTAETSEPCNRILSKRSIQELVAQIDPSERLDPEVEDILLDIADEFVESITTFGCSLAKHRKSTTLEAKDVLLHLERNWNMTLPGFGGDEIKIYRKPFTSEIHKERLASIKKSIASADTTNPRASTGQAAGNAKGHPAKAPMNVLGSPNPKIREAA